MSIAEMTNVVESNDFANELKKSTVGCKLSKKRWGTKRALEDPQNDRAANEFDANAEYFSASKKLINTKDPKFRAITSVLSRASQYWTSVTVPYPEPGIRLLRTDRIPEFEGNMERFRTELSEAISDFDCEFYRLKEAARHDLGDLYNPEDYPHSVADLFQITHEFVQIEPPKHLMELHPEIYEREKQRILSRFNEAVEMAEDAFIKELQEMLDHAIERLTDETGKQKTFKNGLMDNFHQFIDRFSQLNINSSQQLNSLVDQIKHVTSGVDCEMLRKSSDLRGLIKEQMEEARKAMDTMIVDRPIRKFNRD